MQGASVNGLALGHGGRASRSGIDNTVQPVNLGFGQHPFLDLSNRSFTTTARAMRRVVSYAPLNRVPVRADRRGSTHDE